MNIISAYRQVGTYRGAADLCGTTHKTVKRVVERAEAGGPPSRSPRPRNFDSVIELVAARVAASGGRMSAKRLLPVARAAGYGGSERDFRRLVAEQKVLWRKGNTHVRRPAVWSPGEYLVTDWAQATPGLFVFCAILAYSRWRFVRFAADQKASTTMAMIAQTLAVIGGVPAKILADRMGCLKGGVVAGVMIPTLDYVRFASHYGFGADFCHAGDPRSKGIVENLCGYAQSDLAVPLLTEAAITGQPVDLRAANTAAEQWCAEVGSRSSGAPAVAGEVESQRDWSSAGLMTLGCHTVGCGVGRIVEGGQEPSYSVVFGAAPDQPDVVLGHGMAVSLLEFCCGPVDQAGGFTELTLQHVSVGVVGDEN
jgi:transposase